MKTRYGTHGALFAAALFLLPPGLERTASRSLPPQVPELAPLGIVGCALCDGAEAFGLIKGLTVLSNGEVAVLDRDQPMVRIFGEDGRVARTWGRTGDGPGELRIPIGLASTASDRIVVADAMKTGFLAYTASG